MQNVTAPGATTPPLTGTALRYHLMELATTIPDVISLGRGDPDLSTPPHIVVAAKEAMRRGGTAETPVAGLPELRQAIADKLRRENDVVVDPETQVLVTNGVQEALFFTAQTIINPGDEVLVPDPRYTSYDQAIRQAGGKVVLVPTAHEQNFEIDPEVMEAHITPNTRVMLIISPSNPTAAVVSPKTVRRLAEIAIEHNLLVISDEIYERFIWDDAEHLSMASLPGMAERTITLGGLSKAYAMTGWRIGYITGPEPVIRAATALKRLTSGSTPTVSQWAGVAALAGPQDCIDEFRGIYDERRRILLQGLDRMGVSYSRPLGGLYVWVNTASVGLPALELSYRFLTKGPVLIFPGTSFGERWTDYMRVSILQDTDKIEQAVERMQRALAD
jgi:aminotransferase